MERQGYHQTLITANVQLDNKPDSIIGSLRKSNASLDEALPPIDSPDLTFVKFVLASEHENINGDYFSRTELVEARETPSHKPFNIEHTLEEKASYISSPLYNETKNTIVGHIVGSVLARKDGTVLTEDEVAELDMADNPKRPYEDSLDLVASAVLYKFYFPNTIADVEDMAESGDLAVSMEAWFKGYDFMVAGEIVPSTQENFAELTSKWQNREIAGDRRISRVLKGVLFGGVAGVKNPANPDSQFITASIQNELQVIAKRHRELHILYSVDPKEEYLEEHEELMKSAASLLKKQEDNNEK